MSRFRQKKYIDTLKEPHKRYFVAQKEKGLWKFRWNKLTNFIVAWVLVYLAGFSLIVFLFFKFHIGPDLLLPIFLLGWAFLFPVVLGIFFQSKKEKSENRDLLTLNSFIEASEKLKNIKKICVRAIRYALAFVYQINDEIIYPNDTPTTLSPLNKRSRLPLAFEVVLGASIRLQIPLSEDEVDNIIEKIRPSQNVEELICTLAQELETKEKLLSDSGDPNRQILDMDEETIKPINYTKRLLFSLFMGIVFMIWYPFTIYWKKDEPLSLFTALRFFVAFCLGFGLGWLGHWITNLQSKKKPRSSDDLGINLEELKELADNSSEKKYINCCFLDLVSYPQGHKYTFYESDPFPPIPVYDNKKQPSFALVCSKLKRMADMKDCFYRTPQTIKIPLILSENRLYDGIVEICDGIDEAYFSLQVEPSDSEIGNKNDKAV